MYPAPANHTALQLEEELALTASVQAPKPPGTTALAASVAPALPLAQGPTVNAVAATASAKPVPAERAQPELAHPRPQQLPVPYATAPPPLVLHGTGRFTAIVGRGTAVGPGAAGRRAVGNEGDDMDGGAELQDGCAELQAIFTQSAVALAPSAEPDAAGHSWNPLAALLASPGLREAASRVAGGIVRVCVCVCLCVCVCVCVFTVLRWVPNVARAGDAQYYALDGSESRFRPIRNARCVRLDALDAP